MPPVAGSVQEIDTDEELYETIDGLFGAEGRVAATILVAPEGTEAPTTL